MANNNHSSEDGMSDDDEGWLVNPSSIRSPDVDLTKVNLGAILFLRKPHEIRREHFLSANMPKGCLNHPCVVLGVNQLRQAIRVCLITSFGGRRVEDSQHISKWGSYIPMHPTPMHAGSKYQVKLVTGRMQRDGYISTTQVYTVHRSMATLYHGSIDGYRLSRPSFLVVLEHIPSMEGLLKAMIAKEGSSKAAIEGTPQPPQPPQKAPSLELPISKTDDVEGIPSPLQRIQLLSRAWQGVYLLVSGGYCWARSKLRGDIEKEDGVPGLRSML